MQDPNTPDPGGQVGGPPTQAATDGASQPAPASHAIVEPEAPSAIGDAVAVAVEAPQDKEQPTETASTGESASEDVTPGLPPADAVVEPGDVPGTTGEPEAQDGPAQEATTEEPPAEQRDVTPSEYAADETPSAVTEVHDAPGTAEAAEGPAATTLAEDADAAVTIDRPVATAVGEPAGDATDEPAAQARADTVGHVDEPPAEADEESPGEAPETMAAETTEIPASGVTHGIGDSAEDGTGEAAAEGDREASEPIRVETTQTPSEEAEGIRDAPVAEALTAEPTVNEDSAAEIPAAVETAEAVETVPDVTDGPAAETVPDTATQPAEFVGDASPVTKIEEATGNGADSEVAPVFDESVPDSVETQATEEAPSTQDTAEAAQDAEDSAPVGSTMAIAPPAATGVPPARGVWTPEQVGAFRSRLSEATAKVVDRAAGAVIETVNAVASAIRSRTSSQRRGDDHSG